MLPSLHQAFELQVKKQKELNGEYETNQNRDDAVRTAFIWSKAFSSAGKIYLDAAALAEMVEHLRGIEELADYRQTFEIQANSIARLFADLKGSADIVKESAATLETMYATPEEQTAREKLESAKNRYQGISEAATEAVKALTNVNLAIQLRGSGTGTPSLEQQHQAHEAFHSSVATVGQIAGKVLLKVAETEQSGLLDELEDIAVVQKAIDQNFATIVRDTNRIANRYAKAQELRKLVADVLFEHNVCVAQCPDAPGLKAIPDTTGMDYGQVLSSYNAKLAGISTAIDAAAQQFVVKGWTKPEIAVNPKAVSVSGRVTAQFSMAACKATEDSKIKLGDVSSSAVTDELLGDAKPGSPGLLPFNAPSRAGEYMVRIVDQHSRVLASTSLSVTDTKNHPADDGQDKGSFGDNGTLRNLRDSLGRLDPRSFDFSIPARWGHSSCHAQLTATPSYSLSPTQGEFILRWWGSEGAYLQFKALDGQLPKFPSDEWIDYSWQHVDAVRATFSVNGKEVVVDGGNTHEDSEAVFKIPAGAAHLQRIEMYFGSPQKTLIWASQ